MLEAMDGVPAYVTGRRADILAWNQMALAMFGDWSQLPAQQRNWARLVFLSPAYRDLFAEWESKASDIVGFLRMDAGCHSDDPRLSALVGELSVKSADFRRLWARHDVTERSHGVKHFTHPLVGELTLSFEVFKIPDDQDMALYLYDAEPGSRSAEALHLLANWGADAIRAGTPASNPGRAVLP
jgi:hypothetical protein